MPRRRESTLVTACLRWAALHPRECMAWRNQAGAVAAKGGYVRLAPAGAPDIYMLRRGLLIGVELKIGTAKPTPTQQRYKRTLEGHGGAYAVVRDVDEFRRLAEA